jgi:glucosamine-6-phosphate deaminase
MGVKTILESKYCLLLAFGSQKAPAVAATVEGPVTAMVTATALQLHEHTTIVLDELAASDLKRADDYRWAFRHKMV